MSEMPESLAVFAALATLTEKQREALIDYDLLGLTFRQLAERDDVHRSAVEQHVSLGRARMRKALTRPCQRRTRQARPSRFT